MDLRAFVLRHRDPVLGGVLAVAYAVEVLRYPHGDDAVAVPLAILTGLALITRRRLPFATFVVVTFLDVAVVHFAPGLDGNSITFVLVFLLNLWSLGRYARGIEAWLGVLGVLGTVVGFVIGDGARDPSDVFFAMAFCGTPWAAGVAVRLRRERESVLAASNAELEEQARVAVAHERARIARELHDVVSHAIAVTVLQARGGRKLVGRDDDAVRRALDAIEETNTSALSDMRRLLSLLRDTEDDLARDEPQPSLERLDQLVEQRRAAGGAAGRRPVGVPDRARGAHQRHQARRRAGASDGRGALRQ
jgi:signal transduction histidine kinase